MYADPTFTPDPTGNDCLDNGYCEIEDIICPNALDGTINFMVVPQLPQNGILSLRKVYHFEVTEEQP